MFFRAVPRDLDTPRTVLEFPAVLAPLFSGLLCVYKSTSRYNFQEIQTQHGYSMKLTGLSGATIQKAPVARM
jgi:hypothetical protein